MTFDDLGLTPNILEAISRMGFETPTPVQAQVIPRLLANKGDLVALAQTGTGKTAAFGLPILTMLDHENRSPQALVLCPTRELCVQITRDMESFAACSPAVSIVSVYGGTPIQNQLRALRKGVQVIIATPGRMLDILRRKKADLSGVARIILDEADEMLNMGFQEDLEAILSEVPDSAHTLLFSATMPRRVAEIARNYMTNAHEITIGQRNAGAENVTHECYVVHERDRYSALKRIADYYLDMYAIVFCRTRQDTQRVADWLIRDGYDVDALHGDLSQAQRDRVMKKFRSRRLQILVATDVAARGLDVNDLTHVINYSIPDDLGSYTHRSGRTGRAGKSGTSVLIVNMREKGKVRRIEKMVNATFEHRNVPTGREVCEMRLLGLIERMKHVEVHEEQIDRYLPSIYDSLKGMPWEEVVKRFVALEFETLLGYYRDEADLSVQGRPGKPAGDRDRQVKTAPKRKDSVAQKPARPEKKQQKPGRIRMFINLGKADGLNPRKLNDLVGHNAEHSLIIGRIDIMKKYSFFDVQLSEVDKLVLALTTADYHGRAIRVEPVDDEKRGKRVKRTKRRKETRKKGTFDPARRRTRH